MLKNKVLTFAAVAFILVAIPVTVYLVSTQRDQRSHAEQTVATTSDIASQEVQKKEVFDLNNDGRVNTLDLTMVSDKWGDRTKPIEDINQDGNVDIQDLSLVVDHWQ